MSEEAEHIYFNPCINEDGTVDGVTLSQMAAVILHDIITRYNAGELDDFGVKAEVAARIQGEDPLKVLALIGKEED